MFVTGIGDLDDFGSLSTVPATVKVTTSKKVIDKPRITVMYEFCRLFKHFVLMMLLWSWPCIKTRCRIQGCKDTAPLPRWRRITPGLSFVIYGRFLCVCVLLRCFRLSVPVQLIAWKDLSTNVPSGTLNPRWTLTHLLCKAALHFLRDKCICVVKLQCPKFINIIYLDVSISNRDLHQKKLVLSPSETWRDDWLLCQESSHGRDWVDNCPRLDSWLIDLPFRCALLLWSTC